jgi:hypothetical protein
MRYFTVVQVIRDGKTYSEATFLGQSQAKTACYKRETFSVCEAEASDRGFNFTTIPQCGYRPILPTIARLPT